MPNDVALARALADTINSSYTGKIVDIEFSYDLYQDLADLPESPVSYLSIVNATWERQGRGQWMRATEILVTVISRRGPTDNPAWIDEMLDSFDSLINFIGTTEVLGKLPLEMQTQSRYEQEMFESNYRLLTQAILTYDNI